MVGTEVDLLFETAGGLVPIEVTLSATPRPTMVGAIKTFQGYRGSATLPGYVVHPVDVCLTLGLGVNALPFADL